MTAKQASYDRIGVGYDNTRKADPYLVERMYKLLTGEKKDGRYIDIGCGTGNYTLALSNRCLNFSGVDPSDEMLSMAKRKNDQIQWIKGMAEAIPLTSASFDGVLLSLTIHHWGDLDRGIMEVERILKDEGRIVLFTSLPEQTKSYWLRYYFPEMIDASADVLPERAAIHNAMTRAGMSIIKEERYHVQPDLQDLFLYSGKYKPERYLDPEFRKGISSFSMIAHQPEVERGLDKMAADIQSGAIHDIMDQYPSEQGDYIFLVAKKNR